MTIPIPLLEPVVLNEVVRDIRPAENLILSNALRRVPIPTSFYTWDITRNARTMAQFNTPNSEANIVQSGGRGQGRASLAYTREKKVFEPTTTMWIREVGSTTAIQNAETEILAQLQDLVNRVDVLTEYVCWQALGKGKIDINQENVNAEAAFKFDASNFGHVGHSWATATPTQIISDLTGWIIQNQRTNRVNLTDAWVSQVTLGRIFQAFAENSEAGGLLMPQGVRDAYFASGLRQLPNFLGVNWHVVEGQYDTSYDAFTNKGTFTPYLPDDKIIFTNLNEGDPVKIVEGPTADFGAGQGHIGKYTKTWEQEDPSGRVVLLESRWLPIITRPDHIFVIEDVKVPGA